MQHHHSLPYKTTCSAGTLIIDEDTVSVLVPLFKTLVWNVPRLSVTGATHQPKGISSDLDIFSVYGIYRLHNVPVSKASIVVGLLTQVLPPPAEQTGLALDDLAQLLTAEIEQVRFQLRQTNATMSSTRSRYQQGHAHGGGVFGLIRDAQRASKDAKLRTQQPVKEALQQRKIDLEYQRAELNTLKARGYTRVPPAIKA